MNKKILFLILINALLILPIIACAQSDAPCSFIKNVANTLYLIAGTIVVIGWIIAGILYLTSMGGSRMETAKKALVAAVIGTILIVLATTMGGLIANLLNPGWSSINAC